MADESDVTVVTTEQTPRHQERMERHVGLNYREIIGEEAPLEQAGCIQGLYEANLQTGREYWPRENEPGVGRLVFIQRGEARLTVEGEKHLLDAGDLARVRQGSDREAKIKNIGEENLELVIIIYRE